MIPALAAIAVFGLEVVDLGGWTRLPDGGFVLEFGGPKDLATRYVRLELERPGALQLNGATLESAKVIDVSDRLGRDNRLTSTQDRGRARLLVTPRVFVPAAEVAISSSGLRALVTVRNTLENTVNVAVEVRPPGGSEGPSAVATVPPGTSQVVEVKGPFPPGGGRVKIFILKDEEAMEGAYRFVADFDAAEL